VSELSWTAWPMMRSPVRAAVGILFIALVAWTLQSWLRTGYFTVIAVLLLWGQVAGFYLPTRYALTDNGVSVRGIITKRNKEWGDFRSYFVDRDGVLLSPFIGRSRLERFRGLSLQFHGNRDDVVAFVKAALGAEENDAVLDDEGRGEN
jgi:hypothetical protein